MEKKKGRVDSNHLRHAPVPTGDADTAERPPTRRFFLKIQHTQGHHAILFLSECRGGACARAAAGTSPLAAPLAPRPRAPAGVRAGARAASDSSDSDRPTEALPPTDRARLRRGGVGRRPPPRLPPRHAELGNSPCPGACRRFPPFFGAVFELFLMVRCHFSEYHAPRAPAPGAARAPPAADQIQSRRNAAPSAAETAAETDPTAGSRARPADRITRDLIPLPWGLTIVFPLVLVREVDESIYQRLCEYVHKCNLT